MSERNGVKVPARFVTRLKTLAARQAKLRDDLRALQSEVEAFVDDNNQASEDLHFAIEALSRLA